MATGESAERYTPENQELMGDLSNAIALVLPIPANIIDPLYGVDAPAFDRFITEVQQDIVRFVPFDLVGAEPFPPPFKYYQVGPAAGPYRDVIFSLLSDVNTVVQTLDSWVALGEALLLVGNAWRRRRKKENPNAARKDGLTYSARALESICLYDTHERHELTVDIHVESHSRASFLGSAEHPTHDVRQTIVIRTADRSYIYVVDGQAHPFDHFVVKGGRVEPQTLPSWFEEPIRWDDEFGITPFPLSPVFIKGNERF